MALPLRAQLTGTASLTGTLTSSTGPPSRDREAFGVRYRTPPLGKFTVQIGALMTAENGLIEPTAGAGVRHWAIGAEYAVLPWWRAQFLYGNFDELRAMPTTLPQLTYYRFFAIGNQFRLGQTILTIEKLTSAPHQTHAGIHDIVVTAHGRWFDAMVTSLHQSSNQMPYHFLTVEATLRPFVGAPVPFRYLGVEGGTRALPSMTADREVLIPFVALGLFLHFEGPR